MGLGQIILIVIPIMQALPVMPSKPTDIYTLGLQAQSRAFGKLVGVKKRVAFLKSGARRHRVEDGL